MITNHPLAAVRVTHVPTGTVAVASSFDGKIALHKLRHRAAALLRLKLRQAAARQAPPRVVRSYDADAHTSEGGDTPFGRDLDARVANGEAWW